MTMTITMTTTTTTTMTATVSLFVSLALSMHATYNAQTHNLVYSNVVAIVKSNRIYALFRSLSLSVSLSSLTNWDLWKMHRSNRRVHVIRDVREIDVWLVTRQRVRTVHNPQCNLMHTYLTHHRKLSIRISFIAFASLCVVLANCECTPWMASAATLFSVIKMRIANERFSYSSVFQSSFSLSLSHHGMRDECLGPLNMFWLIVASQRHFCTGQTEQMVNGKSVFCNRFETRWPSHMGSFHIQHSFGSYTQQFAHTSDCDRSVAYKIDRSIQSNHWRWAATGVLHNRHQQNPFDQIMAVISPVHCLMSTCECVERVCSCQRLHITEDAKGKQKKKKTSIIIEPMHQYIHVTCDLSMGMGRRIGVCINVVLSQLCIIIFIRLTCKLGHARGDGGGTRPNNRLFDFLIKDKTVDTDKTKRANKNETRSQPASQPAGNRHSLF